MDPGRDRLRGPFLTVARACLLLAFIHAAGAVATAGPDRAPPRVVEDLQHRTNGIPAVEVDWRTAPRSSLRRLALLSGAFLAPYQPTSVRELVTRLIPRAMEDDGQRWSTAERREIARILQRYRSGGAAFGGRLAILDLGPGDVLAREAGLAGSGWSATVEPELTLCFRHGWFAFTPRLEIPLAGTSVGIPDELRYRGWPWPTGLQARGQARHDLPLRIALPRLALGTQFGSWALTVGTFPAVVGAGLEDEGLTLGMTAESVPQVVVRRTRPFVWSGFLRKFDPEHLLLRVGWTSSQTVRYESPWGRSTRRTHPLLTQWLLSWNHRPWWRTTVTQIAFSASRDGHMPAGDLLQINFPVFDTTWNEMDYGPVTDRIVSIVMEVCWRDAPWRGLPRAAGRVWWEYAGEDFRPNDRFRLLPEIAAPASLAGCELIGNRWDLGVEYLETRHPAVLWYSNSGFAEGFTNRGMVLGHELGGAAQAGTMLARWRSYSGAHEWTIRGRSAGWDVPQSTLASAKRRELGATWRYFIEHGAWISNAAWVEETVGDVIDHWWRLHVQRTF